jgi:murein DD-endopeptidase MepM/ murein hydrolase activator NlpD
MTVALAHLLITLVATAASGVWPLQPRPQVVQGFDPPSAPWGSGHRGVDLLGHPGQQVHAAEAGTVRYAGRLAGRGVVVVDHGSTRTTYEPVAARVHVGQQVGAGAVIGILEASPSHCWPRTCLHWGLLSGDTYLNPLSLVGAAPVRLLPLGPVGPLGPVAGSAGAPLPGVPVPFRLARLPRMSGAWMGLPVGLAEPVGGHMGVDLGGRQ